MNLPELPVALLHAGGWDEVVFVAIGLAIAWAIIRFTTRGNDETEEDAEADPPGRDDA